MDSHAGHLWEDLSGFTFVYVSAEDILYSSTRRGLEEGQRGLDHSLENFIVQLRRGTYGSVRNDQAAEQACE